MRRVIVANAPISLNAHRFSARDKKIKEAFITGGVLDELVSEIIKHHHLKGKLPELILKDISRITSANMDKHKGALEDWMTEILPSGGAELKELIARAHGLVDSYVQAIQLKFEQLKNS